MTVADAPTNELGTAGGIVPTTGTAGLANGYLVEGLEFNADLRFPASTVVYDRMRREDGQVASVMRSIVLPILKTRWSLAGTGVRPAVMRFLEGELGLDLGAGRARRRRQGIVLREHLREALLMLPFGFMPFEPVYTVDKAIAGREDPEDPNRLYAHLRKLGPRPPRTLLEVRVGRDGGLAGIVQESTPDANGAVYSGGTLIPVDRLVMYVNDREGADWTGTSILRSAYKDWLIKDALIRLGAQIVERNGMGVPVVTVDRPELRAKGLQLAKAFRAGAEAGAVVEPGMTLQLVGVTGRTIDPLPQTKYHDESIGRSALAMFLNLGHDNGARALGDTFVDLFRDSLGATIGNLEETFTEHVIRDLVELNYGADEPYPMLKADELTDELTAEALKALAEAKIITPDDTLEAHVRRRYSLPAIDKSSRPAPPAPAAPAADPTQPGQDPAAVVVDAHPAPAPPGPVVVPAHTRQAPQRTAAAEDTGGDLIDRLAALTDRVAALKIGHG